MFSFNGGVDADVLVILAQSHSGIAILFPACNLPTRLQTYMIHTSESSMDPHCQTRIHHSVFEQGTTQNDISITAAESIKRGAYPQKSSKLPLTAIHHADTSFQSGSSFNYTSVSFILFGKYKGSFGESFGLALRILFVLFSHPITLCLTKKIPLWNTFPPLHSDLPSLLTGSPPKRRKNEPTWSTFSLTSAIISHLVVIIFFLIFFFFLFSVLVVVMS